MLFISAGIAYQLDQLDPDSFVLPDYSENKNFDFLAAFYYMIVTSSTLGYGDIMPIKRASRMVSVILIFAMVYIIGDQIGKISEIMANYTRYDTKYND